MRQDRLLCQLSTKSFCYREERRHQQYEAQERRQRIQDRLRARQEREDVYNETRDKFYETAGALKSQAQTGTREGAKLEMDEALAKKSHLQIPEGVPFIRPRKRRGE